MTIAEKDRLAAIKERVMNWAAIARAAGASNMLDEDDAKRVLWEASYAFDRLASDAAAVPDVEI